MKHDEGTPYTARDRRAYRAGYMQALLDAQHQIELYRVKSGVRGIAIDVPTHFAVVKRGAPKKGAA